MRKTFDAELLELSRELTSMAATARDAIDLVTSSLSTADAAGAKATIEMTASLDQQERTIENHCMSLLMRQQPVARDLRTISTALKMFTAWSAIRSRYLAMMMRSTARPEWSSW